MPLAKDIARADLEFALVSVIPIDGGGGGRGDFTQPQSPKITSFYSREESQCHKKTLGITRRGRIVGRQQHDKCNGISL